MIVQILKRLHKTIYRKLATFLIYVVIIICIGNICSSWAAILVYPRVVTPNKDKFNNLVIFSIIDDITGAEYSGEIYTIDGTIISKLVNISDILGRTYLLWYCITDDGTPVPPGVYLYQIVSTGEKRQRYRGSIVVAR